MTTDTGNKPLTADELRELLSDKDRVLADTYLATFNKRKAGIAAQYSENGKKYLLRFRRPDMRAYISARLREEVMDAEEVLARLSQRARLDGSEFFEEEHYEVPVFEDKPLTFRISNLEQQIKTLEDLDPERFKGQIDRKKAELAEHELTLTLNPDATYQVQTGTETRTRIVPSLKAAERNGVLQFIEGAEYGPNGLKFKWSDPVRALELIGKHLKLFTDKVEHSGSVDHVLGIDFIMPAPSE